MDIVLDIGHLQVIQTYYPFLLELTVTTVSDEYDDRFESRLKQTTYTQDIWFAAFKLLSGKALILQELILYHRLADSFPARR